MRTFSEVALCHLPDCEIAVVNSLIEEGVTVMFSNHLGLFVWAGASFINCPVLTQILAAATTDYVLFDVDVEPDPELEVSHG